MALSCAACSPRKKWLRKKPNMKPRTLPHAPRSRRPRAGNASTSSFEFLALALAEFQLASSEHLHNCSHGKEQTVVVSRHFNEAVLSIKGFCILVLRIHDNRHRCHGFALVERSFQRAH